MEPRNPVAVAGRSSLAVVDLVGNRAGLVDRSNLGWIAVAARRCRVRRPCASGRDTEEEVRPGNRALVMLRQRVSWSGDGKSQDDVRICWPFLDTARAWITVFGVAEALLWS